MDADATLPRFRGTVAEIHLDAFRENLRSIRKRIPASSKLVAVLKADGYGHGAAPLARVCIEENISMIAVALLEEALALRQEGIDLPVLVLGDVSGDSVGLAFEHGVTLGTPSPESLEAIAQWSAQNRSPIILHLQLDSGMNRMGLIAQDLPDAIDLLNRNPLVEVGGIFSHYANASDPDDTFNDLQRERFTQMLEILREGGIDAPVHHFANSAAIMTNRIEPGDWVRAGISIYGGEALDHGESRLRPVMRWVTRIARLKDVPEGEIVGYGKSWTASRHSRIATLPVGYADGFFRLQSNNGDVLLHGRRAPIIGRVSMDLVTIDVTDIPDAAVGDEVVLLGEQGGDSIRAEEIAERVGTIPYEVFTNVSRRVPRVYL